MKPSASIAAKNGVAEQGRAADSWLIDVVHWCWRVKLKLSLELDLMGRLRQAAEDEAVRVFASNLKDVLMSAPAGGRATLGLDPGIRTGCKVAVIAATGKVLEFATIYPHEPMRKWDESIAILAALCHRHNLELVAIGNGTASRETDKLADDLMKRHPELKLTKVDGVGSGRLDLLGLGICLEGIAGARTSPFAVPFPSRAVCRIRWPNW